MPNRKRHATKAPSAFHVMSKPRGAICNLDCRYCYYLAKEKLYPGSSFCMSNEVLESYIFKYISSQSSPEIVFAWQGGEPLLMGLDFYQKALALQKKFARPGQLIHNTLQTNGTLINEEWAAFIKKNNFLVGLSLDGPAPLHNAYRVDKGGQPGHARVLRGLRLLQSHQVDYNILCCVHKANMNYPLEVYRYFRDELDAQFIQFIPIVQRNNPESSQRDKELRPESVESGQYGRFLIAIFDEWVRRDVGRVFVQIFDVAFNTWLGRSPGLCIFEETCGLALALEHTGDLYACDHFVEPDYLLGNILEHELRFLAGSAEQMHFGRTKRDSLPRYCRECPVLPACNGGCPKDRLALTPAGEPGLNYLCPGYRAFFTHIDAPMKMMASLLRSGRAPAEIMALIRPEHGT